MTSPRVLLASCLVAFGVHAHGAASLDPRLNAALWMQTAAEYAAVTEQTYGAAARMLPSVLLDPFWSGALENGPRSPGMPPAVILDLDETVLDNSPFQAASIAADQSFDPAAWERWLSQAAADAVPGAVAFLRSARRLGVAVFYVTNRACARRAPDGDPCPQEADTARNLDALGLGPVDDAHLLLKGEEPGWGSEKRSRRGVIARTHRIVMLFGDDLGDFLPDVKLSPEHQGDPRTLGVMQEYRRQVRAAFGGWWGTRWFVLPNPGYGSWLRNLGDEPGESLRPSIPVLEMLRQRPDGDAIARELPSPAGQGRDQVRRGAGP